MVLQIDSPSQDDLLWSTQVFRRDGTTPLRAPCRLLTRHTACIDARQEIFVALWERRKGGFVVAHSTLPGSEIGVTATTVRDVEAAMCLMERHCEQIASSSRGQLLKIDGAFHGSPLALALGESVRRIECERLFLGIVGEALDDWERLGTLNPALAVEEV